MVSSRPLTAYCCSLFVRAKVLISHSQAVIREYDQFVSYIEDHGLTGVTELKPIVNGREVSKFLEAPMGPWMSRALDMVIKWQLLHPEVTDKEQALQELASKKEELQINM